jgi:uncharacterized protein (UPF0332 family)
MGDKTMSAEFQECLKRKKIREFSRGKELFQKELDTAQKDLDSANTSFDNKNYKWSTIQSYYSMFHSSRALLYSNNYREKSHFCLIVALRTLYVDKNLLPNSLIENLQKAKMLRENADYYDDWSESAAESLLKSAVEFLSKAKEILQR